MSRFTNFRERLAGAADPTVPDEDDISPPSPPAPVEDEPQPPAEPEKETAMPDPIAVEETAEYQAGLTAGRKAAADRIAAVRASDAFAGREAHAAKLLTTSMEASEIIDLLADYPVATPVDQSAANAVAEEAARAEMRDAMQSRGNASLGTASEPAAAKAPGRDWGELYAAAAKGN